MAQKKINPYIVRIAVEAYEKNGSMEDALFAAAEKARRVGMFSHDSRKGSQQTDIPEFAGKPGGRPKYPFWKMSIGDYEEVFAHPTAVSAAASSYGRRHGMKFTVRSGEFGRAIVWRIS